MTERTHILLLALITLVGCEKEPPPVAEPPQPPPESLQFPTAASTVRYMYFDDAARPVVVGARGDVPDYLLGYSAVLIGERTKSPKGQLYQLDLSQSDERVSTARLADQEEMERSCVAAWQASYQSIALWEEAMVTAQLFDLDKSRPGRRKGGKRGKGSASRAPAIEIVSISDGESDQPIRHSGRSAPRQKVSAPWGWKQVTLYYSPTCGYCRRAMKWMDANNVSYSKRNVKSDLRAQMEMRSALDRAGRRGNGVPTFVIGGSREVMQGWNEDRFVEMAKK